MKIYFIFILVLCLALFVRLFGTQKLSYLCDFDEYSSVQTISGVYVDHLPNQTYFKVNEPPFTGIIAALGNLSRENGNNQAFNLCLKLWASVFGYSDFALRLFCILLDLCSLLVIFFIGRELNSTPFRIVMFSLLFALYPAFVFYSESIRGYSFTTFFALLASLQVIRIFKDEHKINPLIFFALSIFCMVFGHFLSYYVAGTFFLFALIYFKENKMASVKLMATVGLVGLLSASYLFFNSKGMANMQEKSRNYALRDHHKVGETANGIQELSFPKMFVLTVFQYGLKYYCGLFALVGFAQVLGLKMIPLYAFSFFLLIPLYLLFTQWKQVLRNKYQLLFWMLFLAGNISSILIALASGHMTSLGVKYSIFSIPYFLGAIAFFGDDTFLKRILLVGLLLICVLSNVGIMVAKGLKPIPVTVNGEATKLVASELPVFAENLHHQLSLAPDDTIILHSATDVVFLYHLFQPEMKSRVLLIDTACTGICVSNGEKKKSIQFKTEIPD